MEKNNYIHHSGRGRFIVAINDMVEVVSTSNRDIFGKVGTVIEMKEGSEGVDVRIETNDGFNFWIDVEDVILY